MIWEQRGVNTILRGSDFYISYNPNVNTLGAFFEGDDPSDGRETALVTTEGFRILNGDFRKEYEALVPKGLSACIEFFKSKKAQCGSSWTDVKD